MTRTIIASILCGLVGLGCASTTTERRGLPPLEAVSKVELKRYLGTWYEIASFPQRFQRGCSFTTATYTLRADGDIDVLNRCRKTTVGTIPGEETSALGRARVVDKVTNAKLKVAFFRPFWGDYWIIDLAEDYRYAVVGHPSRDYLWILSRSPTMDEETYQRLLEGLRTRGYGTLRLVRTQQSLANAPQMKKG